MELTGKIKVTGGGNLTAELRGAEPHRQARCRGAGHPGAAARAGPPAGVRCPPAPSGRARRRGELKDNLPSLITAFYLSTRDRRAGRAARAR